MDYVYGVFFSDSTAKFGRSTDVWKRMYAYDSESRRFGASIVGVLVCPVNDGVRAERRLLESASELLEQKSRESFSVSTFENVADVFDDAGLPYIACPMKRDSFGPEIVMNSFSPKMEMFDSVGSSSRALSRSDRIKRRVLKLIDTYNGPVTESIIKNRLLNYPIEEAMLVVAEMIEAGEIVLSLSENGRVMEYVRS